MKSTKILIISTSRENLGNTGEKTGIWLEELAAPYYIFKEAGTNITLASPHGGRVPLDPKSQSIMVATSSTKRFLKDEGAMNLLFQSVTLGDISADDFDAVFLTGGHGAMWDIEGDKTVKRLLEAFNSENKLIGCVGHGAVGLLSLQNETGEPLIKGKQLTGFSNNEEESAGLTGVLPFLLETQLLLSGALYSKAANHTNHVVSDGNIITGQNPASSEALAKTMITYLQNNKRVQEPELVINHIV